MILVVARCIRHAAAINSARAAPSCSAVVPLRGECVPQPADEFMGMQAAGGMWGADMIWPLHPRTISGRRTANHSHHEDIYIRCTKS
jgi:hypothetical protein